jgi:expansin (peptidoglycan-binding protein)
VTGPNGSVRIRIVDQCPECPHGNLDFSPEAFDKIADRTAGRVPITWQFVACDVQGPLAYKYKDGANEWWTAVQVRNHRLPVSTLEWSKDGGATWNPTERQDYNYFLDDGGFGPDAVRVRITAVDGQVIEDDLPPVQAELVVEGTSQFQ